MSYNKEQVKKYRSEHIEQYRAYQKRYREAHKEKASLYQAVYRAEHQEQRKAYQDEYKARIYTCECGSVIKLKSKTQHEQSKRHQSFINNI